MESDEKTRLLAEALEPFATDFLRNWSRLARPGRVPPDQTPIGPGTDVTVGHLRRAVEALAAARAAALPA